MLSTVEALSLLISAADLSYYWAIAPQQANTYRAQPHVRCHSVYATQDPQAARSPDLSLHKSSAWRWVAASETRATAAGDRKDGRPHRKRTPQPLSRHMSRHRTASMVLRRMALLSNSFMCGWRHTGAYGRWTRTLSHRHHTPRNKEACSMARPLSAISAHVSRLE
jgi:hypothetical protein